MVPRPPPHPWLGLKKCLEAKNKLKRTIYTSDKMVPKCSQSNPKMVLRPPPHPWLGKKNNCHEAKKSKKTLWG